MKTAILRLPDQGATTCVLTGVWTAKDVRVAGRALFKARKKLQYDLIKQGKENSDGSKQQPDNADTDTKSDASTSTNA